MPNKIRPIRPRSTRKRHATSLILTHFVRMVSLNAGLAVFICSLWYFSGFAENDQGFWHLANAALLSFGIGALFYIPMFWITHMAHKALKSGIDPKILPIILILPWFPICWRLAALGDTWFYIAVCLGLYAGLICIWMSALWKKPRSR